MTRSEILDKYRAERDALDGETDAWKMAAAKHEAALLCAQGDPADVRAGYVEERAKASPARWARLDAKIAVCDEMAAASA